MVSPLPTKIYAGSTCYVHRRDAVTRKDLYTPDFITDPNDKRFTWRYSVSPRHPSTVFFYNESRKKSTWVLPSVDPQTLAERELENDEEMRVENGDGMKEPDPGLVQQKGEEAEETVQNTMRGTSSPRNVCGTAEPSVDPNGRSSADRDGPLDTRLSTTHTLTPVSTEGLVNSSRRGEQAPSDEASKEQQSTEAVSDAAPSVQERFAAWREKRQRQQQRQEQLQQSHQQQQSLSATKMPASHQVHVDVQDVVAPGVANPPDNNGRLSSSPPQPAPSPSPTSREVPAAVAPQAASSSLVLQKAEGKNTQEEQKERMEEERARRTRAVAELEDAERLRLARERRAMEERRVWLLKEEIRQKEEAIKTRARELAERKEAERLNSFSSKQQTIVSHLEADVSAACAFEEAVAHRLLLSVQNVTRGGDPLDGRQLVLQPGFPLAAHSQEKGEPKKDIYARRGIAPSAAAVERRAMMTNSTTTNNKSRAGNQAVTTVRRQGRIAYTPEFVYMGDLTTSARVLPISSSGSGSRAPITAVPSSSSRKVDGTPPLGVRDGKGTMYYDKDKRYFYQGQFADDVKSGRGVMSLPEVAVEGNWRHDRPQGQVLLQSRQMKGTVTCAPVDHHNNNNNHQAFRSKPQRTSDKDDALLQGPAILETSNASRFVGNVRDARVGAPAAMHLSSGDRVEWLPVEAAGSKEAEADEEEGTGECRVRFANGDRYVGYVRQYVLHGTGRYDFRADGHSFYGTFAQGHMQGNGTYRFADGDVYVGELHKGLFHGLGCYLHRDAYLYEGEWEHGAMHGRGRLTWMNGDVWEGLFDQDRRVSGAYTATELRPSS